MSKVYPAPLPEGYDDKQRDVRPYQRRKAFVKKKVKITFCLDADSESEAESLQSQLADHLKSGKPVEDFRVYG